jgi:competence/damage-inducible protein CinA-like protein
MSTTSSSPTVEVVAIGSELLQGEIADTNTGEIARRLRQVGLELSRATLVPDDLQQIAAALREAMDRAPIVITSGGLGPTVDDPTRQAVALALGRSTQFHPELWLQIQERFARYGRTPSENNRRQAILPSGATALENPIGTAPAFLVETDERSIIALPGVPAELTALLEQRVLPYLQQRFHLQTVACARLIRTAGVGESTVDVAIQDLEQLSNPTVGLSAHPGRVDVRIVARADSSPACQRMLDEMETTLRERLGEAVYGVDATRLEDAVVAALERRSWRLAVVECATAAALTSAFAQAASSRVETQSLAEPMDGQALHDRVHRDRADSRADVGLGISLHRVGSRHQLDVCLLTPEHQAEERFFYGGPPDYAPFWSVSLSLDFLRRRLA